MSGSPTTDGEAIRLLEVAVVLDDPDLADLLVAWVLRKAEAAGVRADEQTVRENIAYYAGYHGPEARERVERVFRTAHPTLGAVGKWGHPTAAECLETGRRFAAWQALPPPRPPFVPYRDPKTCTHRWADGGPADVSTAGAWFCARCGACDA